MHPIVEFESSGGWVHPDTCNKPWTSADRADHKWQQMILEFEF